MTCPDDTGPEGSRAVAGRLVYDPSYATVDKATLDELVALRRDGASRNHRRPKRLGGAQVEFRDVEPGEDGLLFPVSFPG